MKMLQKCVWVLALSAAASCVSAATLEADYQVQNTLDSSVGSIGPLTVVGPAAGVTFVTATVDTQSQQVLSFETDSGGAQSGVQAETDGFISSSNYSIVFLGSFSFSTDLVATKLFDFKNLSSDDGLYVNDSTGLLDFNGVLGATGGTPVVSGSYAQIVLTRDGSTGLTSIYEDGTLAFSFTDSADQATLGDTTPTSTNAFLTLFKDDGTGLGGGLVDETTTGTLARLRLYDGPLTTDQVAALDRTTPVPEPLIPSALAILTLVRRRR